MTRLGTVLLLAAFWWAWALAGVAFADPISAAIVGFIGLTGTAAAVATFLINTAISIAISFLAQKLLGPSQNLQQRQAAVLNIDIGESPREAIFGIGATGGSLADAFNFGGDYGTDWEVMVVPLADHLCHSLLGFYVNDKLEPFVADGAVAGYNGHLEVYFRAGAMDQAFPASLVAHSNYDGDDNLAGVAHVWVAYKADKPGTKTPIWSAGRPRFKWIVKGKLCYDPRLDDTVEGGSGDHRWDDPTTWEWSENAYVCRYNWVRGIYAGDQVDDPTQLLIGRGLSALEAPPERVAARANICDEAVALLAGGTEPRYRVGGVVRSSEPFLTTEEYFAAAMAGVITQPEGGVEIEPGVAKTGVFAITDADLVAGEPIEWSPFKPAAERVNTVIPRFISPTQIWEDHAAPVRRVLADVTADGNPVEATLSLALVTSGTQAQRCGEIARRLARLDHSGKLPLGPRFAGLEEGDWGTYTSARRTGGETITVRVRGYSLGKEWRTVLALEQVTSNAFAWTAADDELVDGAGDPPEPAEFTPIGPPLDFAAVAAVLTSSDLSSFPAIHASASVPVDPRVIAMEIQRAPAGTDPVSAFDWQEAVVAPKADNPVADLLGVVPGASYDVRARNYTNEHFVSEWVYVYGVTIPTGSSNPSGGFAGGGPAVPLDRPTDLDATSPGPDEATVTWVNPLAAQFDHIRVFRGTTATFGSASDVSGSLAGVWGGAMSFDDTPAGPDDFYYWAVAYDAGETESASAGPVMVHVDVAVLVSDLTLAWTPGADPVLTWGAPAGSPDHLKLLRATTDDFASAADVSGSLSSSAVTFTDTGAAADTTVYFWWLAGYDAGDVLLAVSNDVAGASGSGSFTGGTLTGSTNWYYGGGPDNSVLSEISDTGLAFTLPARAGDWLGVATANSATPSQGYDFDRPSYDDANATIGYTWGLEARLGASAMTIGFYLGGTTGFVVTWDGALGGTPTPAPASGGTVHVDFAQGFNPGGYGIGPGPHTPALGGHFNDESYVGTIGGAGGSWTLTWVSN